MEHLRSDINKMTYHPSTWEVEKQRAERSSRSSSATMNSRLAWATRDMQSKQKPTKQPNKWKEC